MKLSPYLKKALDDFPKPSEENKIDPEGHPYIWLAYDFDEMNEWVAKWLQFNGEDATIDSEESTEFTCHVCGEKWNLISPKSDTDTCPECGITVYSKELRTNDK